MNFNPNLKMDEIMLRYVLLILVGIAGGVLQNWWFVIPVMAIFLTAILGWCPIKAYIIARRERRTA